MFQLRNVVLFATLVVGATLLSACGAQPSATPPPAGSPPEVVSGFKIAKQHGCLGCHSMDGRKLSASTLKGLPGSNVTLDNGTVVVADEAYMRRTITHPDDEIVKGYKKGVMSAAMKNQPQLSESEINDLVAYMMSLK